MPAHANYPQAADLESYLRALGILTDVQMAALLSFLSLEEATAAARSEWESETGWRPFLADASPVTRYYDPQGPNFRPHTVGGGYRLDLEAGLIALTSVIVDVDAESPGTTLVSGEDFWLDPYNAAVMGLPYTAVLFVVRRWGARRSIAVTGRFGFAETLPDDVWQCVLQKSAAVTFAALRERASAGLVEWKEADVSERYGENFLESSRRAWEEAFRRAAGRYRRVTL